MSWRRPTGAQGRAGRWRVPERYTTVVYKGTVEIATRPPERPALRR